MIHLLAFVWEDNAWWEPYVAYPAFVFMITLAILWVKRAN